MKKAILSFDLIKLGDNSFYVDPTSIYVKGVFNWVMLNDFLFEPKDSCLQEIAKDMNMENETHTEVHLEIWEDSDDFRSWIDYKILNEFPDESSIHQEPKGIHIRLGEEARKYAKELMGDQPYGMTELHFLNGGIHILNELYPKE